MCGECLCGGGRRRDVTCQRLASIDNPRLTCMHLISAVAFGIVSLSGCSTSVVATRVITASMLAAKVRMRSVEARTDANAMCSDHLDHWVAAYPLPLYHHCVTQTRQWGGVGDGGAAWIVG